MGFSKGPVLAALMVLMVLVSLGGCGGGSSNSSEPKPESVIRSPSLSNGEAAVRVIGQPDFSSSSENQGGAPGLQTMGSAYGAPVLYENNL